ncbi:MAG: hypothetical protein IKV48_06430, partial [Eggerthellaceae bacterium]|nr:hypothetical protein [Eggerthellaceae bacterium]
GGAGIGNTRKWRADTQWLRQRRRTDTHGGATRMGWRLPLDAATGDPLDAAADDPHQTATAIPSFKN